MKKAAIIIKESPNIRDLDSYQILIGVENGSKFVLDNEDKFETYHIGDYDSVEEEFKEFIKSKDNVFYMEDELKEFADGEEAIIKAKELGCSEIDIYADTDGRDDHFINMVLIARKHSINIFGNELSIQVVKGSKTINKEFDYTSLFFFEETKIKTNGLKWDVDRTYDFESGTNFISNKVIGNSFEITTDKRVVVMQVKEK